MRKRMLVVALLVILAPLQGAGCRECVTCESPGEPSAVAPARGGCEYNVVSEQRAYPGEGWNGSFSVNTKPENTCPWRAVSRDTSCVVITSSDNGVGDAQVSWRLLLNGSRGRTCIISVSGTGWSEDVRIEQNPR